MGCVAAVAVLAACQSMPNGAPLETRPTSETMRTIEGVPITLAPRSASTAEKYNHYRNIVIAAGGRWTPDRPYVLALRGLNYDTGRISEPRASSTMQDTIVVLRPGSDGQPLVYEFLGSTHPSTANVSLEGLGVDVDRDGVRDVGMVIEGSFRANEHREFLGAPSFHITTFGGSGQLRAVRDTDNDGIFSPQERAASREDGHTMGAILYHIGWSSTQGNSIGCFNVGDYDAFLAAVGGAHTNFNTTVVNAFAAER